MTTYEQARITEQYGDVARIQYTDLKGKEREVDLDRFEHKVVGTQGEIGRLREIEGKYVFVPYTLLTQPATKITVVAIGTPTFAARLRTLFSGKRKLPLRTIIIVNVRERHEIEPGKHAFKWRQIGPVPLTPGDTLSIFDGTKRMEHDDDFDVRPKDQRP